MGDTANGRSTTAWMRPRPRNRPRTRASAVPTPNTTLSGTTIATMSSDRLSAEIAAGVLIDSRNAPTPSPNVRTRMSTIGHGEQEHEVAERDGAQAEPGGGRGLHWASSSRRWLRPANTRSTNRVTKAIASSATDTAAALSGPVDLDLLLDVLRGDLGLARDVAADEHDRAVLADRRGRTPARCR